MDDFHQFLMIFSWNSLIYWASVYKEVGGRATGMGWVVTKAKTEQDDTSSRDEWL